MIEIIVHTKNGKPVEHIVCDKSKCSIGKDKECLINLHGWKVGQIHASLELKDAGVFIEDGNTRAGSFVNDQRVNASASYGPLNVKDIISIGDYRIKVRPTKKVAQVEQAVVVDKPIVDISLASVEKNSKDTTVVSTPVPVVNEQDGEDQRIQSIYEEYRLKLHNDLLQLIDLRRVNVSAMDDEELREFTQESIGELVQYIADAPPEISITELTEQVLAEAVGLGPLEKLLDDDDISEIMVNSHRDIFYEKSGQLKKSKVTFTDDKAVMSAIERIVSPLGRRIDESSPMVDARLKDGSRVNAVIPPLALKGPSITIRKFMKERLSADKLIDFNSANQVMINFLETCIDSKKNVVISGGTGSGKTTLLNIMSNFIPDNERVVTVEDAAELMLYQPNLVSLEARPANQEGKGSISIRELVKNCLRMRPDRIVVGECRGGEALDMLQAMNTGHDGSLTTVHSNSPRDCISRLEVLVLMSGMDLPITAIREQISSSVDIIVQQSRFSCGSRKITSICEVTGIESNVVQLSEIFKFDQQGYDDSGKVKGVFKATGMVPEFYEDMKNRKIDVDFSIFSNGN